MIKPILFNSEMVRAILDGNKTVTRRIVKPQPNDETFTDRGADYGILYDSDFNAVSNLGFGVEDILWVRETWCKLSILADDMCTPVGDANYYYAADGFNPTPFNSFPDENGWCGDRRCPRWHPSIHMPKEAARIFLRVTGVRVERLQDITVQDAKREGAFHACGMCFHWHDFCGKQVTLARDCKIDEISPEFPRLWDSTIKKQDLDRYGWDVNPWVWVIEFERCEKPEGF